MTTETDTTVTFREIWTRKIEGSRALIPYAGTLVLLASGNDLFIEARVTRPARITVRRPVRGNQRDEFKVGPIACRHAVSNFNRTATHVSFAYQVEAAYFGWFTLYSGPVVAALPTADELERSYEQSVALLRSIGAEQVALMTSESLSL
jgi:hypothetical protein